MKVIVKFEEPLIGNEVYGTGYGYELAGYFIVTNKLWKALQFSFEWVSKPGCISFLGEDPIEMADMICPEPQLLDRVCIKNKYYKEVRRMIKHLQKIGAIEN